MGEMKTLAVPASTYEPTADAQRVAQTYALLGVCPFEIGGPKNSGHGKIVWAEPALSARLMRAQIGLLPSSEEAFERRLSTVSRRKRHAARRTLSWDGARYCVAYKLDLFDGRTLWVEERGQRLSGEGKKAHHILATLTDIEDRKRAEKAAVYRAGHDPLTGLWNESRFSEILIFQHLSARKYKKDFAFFRLRVSNIPDINKTYGYEVGDRVMKGVAERLQETFQLPDMLARIGGISFGVSVTDCSAHDISERLDIILKSFSDVPYPSPHGDLYAECTVSVVTVSHKDSFDIDDAISASSAAMQAALASGARACIYDSKLHDAPKKAQRRETTTEHIISALNDRRVSLAYQPIVSAATRDLHHYECLLRLKRGDGEIVSAGAFIMAAERLGLVHLLDRRALELASETLLRYPDIKLALNVSAATVKNEEAAENYLTALRALGPATQRVTLELTETVALEDPAMASRFSVEARMLGCQFSIDDFGSGHTTFQNLMAIEADSIKIDGSFIRELSLTPHKQTFVRMMVDLAQTFSVKTVAEMVETREDAELLNRLGVDYLQGYLFGVPSAAPAWQRS
jgi:diguanylate cyclase (GGDEF)-like protein